MNNLRYMGKVAQRCVLTWINTSRTWIVLGMIACFVIIYAVPFSRNAEVQGQPLQCCEIFIALLNWRFTTLLFSSSALILFGDLPILDRFTSSSLLAGTRRAWLYGQMVYILIVALFLPILIFLLSLLISMPNILSVNEWSKPVRALAIGNRIAIPATEMKLPMPDYIVRYFSPWQAFLLSYTLFSLMLTLYGMLSLCLKLRVQSGGFVVLLLSNILSWTLSALDTSGKIYAICAFLSLHFHSSLFLHNSCALNPYVPTLSMSYLILSFGILATMLLALRFIKRYDFVDLKEQAQ